MNNDSKSLKRLAKLKKREAKLNSKLYETQRYILKIIGENPYFRYFKVRE